MFCLTGKRYYRLYNDKYFWETKISLDYSLQVSSYPSTNFRHLYLEIAGNPIKLDINHLASLKYIGRTANFLPISYVLIRTKINEELINQILYDVVKYGTFRLFYQLEPYIPKHYKYIYWELVVVRAAKNGTLNTVEKIKNKIKNYWYQVARGAILGNNLKLLNRCLRKMNITKGKTIHNFSKKINNITHLLAEAAATNYSPNILTILTEKYYLPNIDILAKYTDELVWLGAATSQAGQSLEYIKFHFTNLNILAINRLIGVAIDLNDADILDKIIKYHIHLGKCTQDEIVQCLNTGLLIAVDQGRLIIIRRLLQWGAYNVDRALELAAPLIKDQIMQFIINP